MCMPSVLWNFNNDTNESMSESMNQWVSGSGVCKTPLASWDNGAKKVFTKMNAENNICPDARKKMSKYSLVLVLYSNDL